MTIQTSPTASSEGSLTVVRERQGRTSRATVDASGTSPRCYTGRRGSVALRLGCADCSQSGVLYTESRPYVATVLWRSHDSAGIDPRRCSSRLRLLGRASLATLWRYRVLCPHDSETGHSTARCTARCTRRRDARTGTRRLRTLLRRESGHECRFPGSSRVGSRGQTPGERVGTRR
jgi:hypothetical protein